MDKKKSQDKIIFHVDMDSFYASCELAKRPDLKEVPFIVGADPNQGEGRGVVLACNYPARKLGVKSAMPISRAWELAPNANYVLPDHELYGRVSKHLMEILSSFADKVEQVSIDEAYLDFSDEILISSSNERQDRNLIIRSITSAIKKKVLEKEKITCSVGVSNSKITAKIATDMNKPDGLTIVEPRDVRNFLSPLPVERIPGIGKVTKKKLTDSFGVRTIGDLSKVPMESLEEKFGKSAYWFHRVSVGEDESEVVSKWEPVSQSSETTLSEDESSYDALSALLKDLAAEVVKRVTEEDYLFRNVGIKIRFSGFETHTRSHALASPTDSFDIAFNECNRMLSEFAHNGKKVRLLGVRLSQLKKKERKEGQSSLLGWS